MCILNLEFQDFIELSIPYMHATRIFEGSIFFSQIELYSLQFFCVSFLVMVFMWKKGRAL